MAKRLTKKEIDAIVIALHCEIITRSAGVLNDLGERCDIPQGEGALDDEVPAMKSAMEKLKERR